LLRGEKIGKSPLVRGFRGILFFLTKWRRALKNKEASRLVLIE
jgi:hypothetical protein